MATTKAYVGEKFEEAENYLNHHKIPEMFQTITTALLFERPEHPGRFIAKQLQLMRSMKARNQNHVVFTKENLVALFRCFDNVGRGHITGEQYNEAMRTIGASKYNQKPTGFGIDRITMDTFTEEAMTALRKL